MLQNEYQVMGHIILKLYMQVKFEKVVNTPYLIFQIDKGPVLYRQKA